MVLSIKRNKTRDPKSIHHLYLHEHHNNKDREAETIEHEDDVIPRQIQQIGQKGKEQILQQKPTKKITITKKTRGKRKDKSGKRKVGD